MHRIDTSTAQKDKFGVGKNGFTTGDPQSGTPATEVSAEILDALQEEIAAVIEDPDSGMTLSKQNNAQLLSAIKKIITAKSINQSTLKTMFAGIAFPWPTATPPDGFISLTGQAINQATDPLLYARFGATAPDMRGNVARGWDNNRGIDTGRTLLSEQGDAMRNIIASLNDVYGASLTSSGAMAGAVIEDSVQTYASGSNKFKRVASGLFDASRVVPTANENRMRNVAWNYITLRG